ncbi:MAG: poly(R)-hydroxyalkanoic acid synthase subunit PhaE [Syntrophales bacterium]|jgi:class III poly(R)-hydroxyalkanoic acid synthase PhaE subunit
MEKSSVELTHEFFDQWLKTYESTYGRLVEMPAMGPMRERSEKMVRNFSVSVNLYTAWMESLVNFQNIFMEAMRRMREKMTTEMEGEVRPERYKDFYQLWIETYSETFKEFLKSGHFSSDMGRLTSYFVDFQKSNRDLVEENVLKPVNLPTRTEIDEMNRELYTLKKTAKNLTKDMDSLKRTMQELTSQVKEPSEERS